MPDHIVVEDSACPRCHSPLVTLEGDASDDRITRGRIRRSGRFVRWVGIVGSIIVAGTTYQIVRLLRDGGSLDEWRPALEGMVLITIVVVPTVIAAVRLWDYVHTRRTGRLAMCHACGHRWPLL